MQTPAVLRALPGDLVVVLSDAEIVSFAGPFFEGARRVVGIRGLAQRPFGLPNVAPNVNTRAVLPAAVVPATHTVFAGITVRDNEDAAVPLRVQTAGHGLARVKGPVAANDLLGLSAGPGADDGNYFIGSSSLALCRCQMAVPAGEIRLVPVCFGGGGGGSSKPTWLP